ncbi:hypothetical protein BDV37DRAFT_244082 [Aspergillus pseudonomiae]|uniref:Uncharacterized protein n=1 Tax=Aspergillus pseudonomiae TaxID=1506151 RepID=A0A5N7DIF6_9EURO|nr:uncharacterized protein BDV37DRAFT_244082 [Aspergillus pseudonomiae]KAE8406114.1 hypothetical protein BDV37DRAFT_244082 [Aspergillus pseudonomiae]
MPFYTTNHKAPITAPTKPNPSPHTHAETHKETGRTITTIQFSSKQSQARHRHASTPVAGVYIISSRDAVPESRRQYRYHLYRISSCLAILWRVYLSIHLSIHLSNLFWTLFLAVWR